MIALRAADRDDVAAVLTFWSVATAEPSSTDDAAAIESLLQHSPGALLLAIDGDASGDGAIVGTVIAGWDGWRGTVYRLAVAPERRREGIATALVEGAEQYLRAQGARRMHLIVGRGGGAGAEAFWSSARYEPTDQLRMVKDLA